MSSDLTPYRLAAAEVVSEGGRHVETVTLAPDQRNYDLAVRAVWLAKPDAIVALGVRALDVATREFTNVPVVFGMVADAYDYSDKTSRMAGVELIPSPSQVLRAMRAVLPKVDQVAIVFDPQRSTEKIDKFIEAGAGLGIKVRRVRFSRDADVGEHLRSVAGSCDYLIVYPDAVLLSDEVFGQIALRAFELGLPTVAYSSAFAHKGAVMSVEADYASIGRDLGDMVGQVLGGASTGAIGIRSPSRVRVTVNKAVADQLDITANVLPLSLPADMIPSVEVIADVPTIK